MSAAEKLGGRAEGIRGIGNFLVIACTIKRIFIILKYQMKYHLLPGNEEAF